MSAPRSPPSRTQERGPVSRSASASTSILTPVARATPSACAGRPSPSPGRSDYERARVDHLIIDLMNRDDHSVPPLTSVLEQIAWLADLTRDRSWYTPRDQQSVP
jgi:hypothetical protein